MSVTYIPVELRRLVVSRAEELCEYCLIAEDDTFYGCEVDHIISEKHGGATEGGNLAYACVFCNQAKGSDVGSIHWDSGEFIRFFNPRVDRWADHFLLVEGQIEGITPIGAVTARILAFNSTERVVERQMLQAMNRYPNTAALERMKREASS
jgi:HNH endonuclease